MLLETYSYTQEWNKALNGALDSKNTLVIVFASSKVDLIKTALLELSSTFKNSIIMGASTAGEIYQDELYEDSLVVAVMQFQNTRLQNSICTLISTDNSFEDGVDIANDLLHDDLKGIFLLCDGLNANGDKLTEGLSSVIPNTIPITGGLAGDAERFEQTWILVDNKPMTGFVCAVGLYGPHVHISYASKDEWVRKDDSSEDLNLENYNDEDILAIAISCVKRKSLLKNKLKTELEAMADFIPAKAQQIGFYSYGEISPLASGKCVLHNETTAMTLIWESKE